MLEPNRDFVGGWVVDAICDHLEAVSRGEITRLLINVPPGCMKSLTTNVFWPAWEWGPRGCPGNRYVCASYSETLTIRDNRRCRNLINSAAYQEQWGDVFSLTADQNAKVRFDTDKTGWKIATSVGGVGTGERGDRVIVDDPHNVKETESDVKRDSVLQWFTEVLPTRINDPEKSAIVVIMQRVHERDVSGHILRAELGYDHLCLPMEYEPDHPYRSKTRINFHDPREKEEELLWPERFPKNYLETDLKPVLRSWGGEYGVAGQLQQRPAPRGGGMFRREDFRVVNAPAERARKVRGWDLASTSGGGAFTAGVLLSVDGSRIYIEDVVRGQWSSRKVEEKIEATAEYDGHDVVISIPQDPGQAGVHQKAAYAALLKGYEVRFSPETGSKEQRAVPISAQAEAGNVALVRGEWNELFLREAETFPRGAYKDQIDALSRAYAQLIKRRGRVSVAGAELVAQ